MPTGPRPRPPDGCIRVVHSGTNNPGVWANVHWLKVPAGLTPSSADMNALAALVGNAWGSNVISKMSTNVIHTNTSLSLYGAAGDLYEGTAALALAGSKTGVVAPAQVAAGISWSVTVGYRGGHPRSYIPGLVIPDTATVQTLSSIFASSLAAGANTYRTSVNAYTTAPFTSVTLGTVSFVRAKAWRTPPVFIPFGSAHVDVRIDTLRNRLGPDLP